jgi:diguanylate cyclase (GGDEF)-like protein
LTPYALVGVVLAVVFFTVDAIRPVLPWVLLWLPGLAVSVVLVVNAWRTAQAAHLPTPTRRLWRHVTLAAILVALGHVAEAADAVTTPSPSGPQVSPGQLVFHGAAILLVIYALLRLPFGRQSRGEVFRIVLDAGTIMLACAVFIWHFSTRYAIDNADRRVLFTSLALTLLAMQAVFAVAKVMLTTHASYLDGGSLRMIGLAVAGGALFPALRPLIEQINSHLCPDMIAMPVIYLFGGWAAERQRAAGYGPRRGVRTPRLRPFSVLPYVAVAAVDALLLVVVLPEGAADRQVIVVSAVVLTAVVVVRQITAFLDNGRLLRSLDHGATHDALTQLPNRVLFHERLRKSLSGPVDRPVSVALIDLDDFKEVNDTLGHEVGDLLLIAVAERLGGCVRTEDTVARLGGDEFVVVLDGADPGAADLAAQRMIDALRAPVLADGHELPIRASIGIADGGSGDDPSMLLRHADIAMYAAKRIAGTASLHYHPGMAPAGAARVSGADLREAIDNDRLFLLYQPIVALDDGRVTGAEALVRWRHPAHGTLPPDAFIPVAERTGLIVPLGQWVLRTALTQLKAWPTLSNLNINISVRDLREPRFAATVAALLAEHGIAGDRLTLEITESMAATPHECVETLADLRALGVRLALDDFGTGYSTLTMLQDCPVDELKLDRSFTQAARGSIAAGVLNLARTMGLRIVAEGIETPEQRDRLRDLGYVVAQGYHFARPMPADEFGVLLTGTPFTSAV